MLEDRPKADLAVIADEEAGHGAVLIAVGRRDAFTCVLRIAREDYDGVLLFELIRQHTVH
jgi:hypothetical protein